MLLIGSNSLEAFAKKQPTARKRFASWLKVVRASQWKNLEEVKSTYQQTDGGVKKDYTVFNVGSFRVVAKIDYAESIIAVVFVFTHAEYTHWSDKK